MKTMQSKTAEVFIADLRSRGGARPKALPRLFDEGIEFLVGDSACLHGLCDRLRGLRNREGRFDVTSNQLVHVLANILPGGSRPLV